MLLTIERSPVFCPKASPIDRCCCTPASVVANCLCWMYDSRSASRETACSNISASSVCGIVVGRIILFFTRFRSSRSSLSYGTHRRIIGSVASARTFEIE